MNHSYYLFFIVIFPLCTALLNAFVFRNRSVVLTCAVATAGVFGSFLLSVSLYLNLFLSHTPAATAHFFNWLTVPMLNSAQFNIPFALVLDKLSVVFLLVTTGVGTLIHFYSGQYMDEDKTPYRYFVYLNLFIVSMIILVLGENMLVTFLGWEGVGVCSYLLVGYWFEDKHNSLAALKAFIVNRVGDVGFLLAMFLCIKTFGTISYAGLNTQISALSASGGIDIHSTVILLIGFGLLLGVTGKSAQIPLYTWLPDAMAGPTPVSALIHAATMVTAGIYLLNRVSYLLVLSPIVMHTIAILGAATAFFAATIALTQTDIKKVLAYSTCSQLGYMVLACGVGAFDFGVAHVVSQAFFKACLFLGAGSIMHAMGGEQDMRNMGGILKKMPITSVTFLIAVLAIIGMPPFSGYYTKDAILESAMVGQFGNPMLWFVGYLSAGLTAMYMLRLTMLVFFGKCRSKDAKHIHENSPVMTIPLIILAFLSATGGAILLIYPPVQISHTLHRTLMIITTSLVILCASLNIFVYRKGLNNGKIYSKLLGPFYTIAHEKWKIDELYQAVFVNPLKQLGLFLYHFFDRGLVDKLVNGIPKTFYFTTSIIGDGQAGNVRNYLKLMFFSLVLLFFVLILYLMN